MTLLTDLWVPVVPTVNPTRPKRVKYAVRILGPLFPALCAVALVSMIGFGINSRMIWNRQQQVVDCFIRNGLARADITPQYYRQVERDLRISTSTPEPERLVRQAAAEATWLPGGAHWLSNEVVACRVDGSWNVGDEWPFPDRMERLQTGERPLFAPTSATTYTPPQSVRRFLVVQERMMDAEKLLSSPTLFPRVE